MIGILRLRTALLLGIVPPLLATCAVAAWWLWRSGAPGYALVLLPLLALAAAVGVAVWIDRRLCLSLADLENAIIAAATAEHGDARGPIASIELRGIADPLGAEADGWRGKLAAIEAENLALEEAVQTRDLLERLGSELPVRTIPSLHAEWLDHDPIFPDASGFAVAPGGSHLVAWLANPSDTGPLEALGLRREIGLLCRRFLERHPDAPAALLPLLRPIRRREVTAFVVVDGARRRIDVIARRPITLIVASTGSPGREVQLSGERSIPVEAGGFAILASAADPLLAAASSPALRARLAARAEGTPADTAASGLVIALTQGAPSIHLPFPVVSR